MKKYENPLDKEYHSSKRLTLRVAVIAFYILVFPQILVALSMLLRFPTLTNEEKFTALTVSFFLVLSAVLAKLLLFTKGYDLSLKYIRGLFDYKELHEAIGREEFTEIAMKKAFMGSRTDRLFESEHWLLIDGYFIPKNFILGSYALVKRGMKFESQDLFEMQLVLINGKEHCYSIGISQDDVKETYRVLSEILPNSEIKNNFAMANYVYEHKKEIKNSFNELKKDKRAFLQLIMSDTSAKDIINIDKN